MLPESICMLPWISIEASPMGTARPCCLAREDITGIDLRTHSLQDAYKSEYMQQMRQQMRAGEKPATCKLCWDEEAAGIPSMRLMRENGGKEHPYATFYHHIPRKSPQTLDLKLSNLCNLKCRICNWRRSSQRAVEQINILSLKKKDRSFTCLHLVHFFILQFFDQ